MTQLKKLFFPSVVKLRSNPLETSFLCKHRIENLGGRVKLNVLMGIKLLTFILKSKGI